MNSNLRAEIAARDGDHRVQLLLGIANLFLFLDHIPHNAVNTLTLHNFGFSGAIDLFAFVGGYAVAITYARIILERGFVVGATRVFRRLWQLYAAYVVLFVIYVDLIGYVASLTAAPEIITEFNITGFIDHPIRTLIYGLLLQAQPLNLDVLQVLITMMAVFPIILFGMLRWPLLTLTCSASLYVATLIFDWNLSSFPDGRWHFNPFSWQFLFVLGSWFALMGPGQARLMRSMQEIAAMRVAALLYLIFALTITAAGELSLLQGVIPSPLFAAFLPVDQENPAPYRVLHFLALAFLFTLLIPKDWHGLRSPAFQPIIKCGEQWLAVFCAGVFLSFTAHSVLITGPNSLLRQVLVSLAGILVMICIAYYVSWSKRQDHQSAFGARS